MAPISASWAASPSSARKPGARATAVARRLGADVSLLYRWRRQFFGPQPRLPAFLPVTVALGEPPAETAALTPEPSAPPTGTIEVEFAIARLRITGTVDPVVISTVIAALMERPA